MDIKTKKRTLSKGIFIGYMEACLINFNVIESKENGLADYAQNVEHNYFGFKTSEKEDRREIVIRLTEKFLKENNLI